MPRVLYSQVLDAPAKRVWALIRDFGGLTAWMPGIAQCVLRADSRPDQVGAVRIITRVEGLVIEETLRELSDLDQRIVFNSTRGEVPTRNARATIRVQEIVADGRAYVEWYADFDVVGDPAPVVALGARWFFSPQPGGAGARRTGRRVRRAAAPGR